MKPDGRKSQIFKIAVLATVALMLCTLQYRMRMLNEPNAAGPYATTLIGELRSEPPYQRRVLAPWLAVQTQRATGIGLDEIEFLGRFVFLTGVLVAAGVLAAGLMGTAAGFIAPLLLAALIPLGFFMNQVIDSYPSMLMLLLGLICLQGRQFVWLLPIFAFGTFFRETTALLLPVLALMPVPADQARAKWSWLAGMTVLFFVVRGVLQTLFPGEGFVFSLWFNLWYLFGEPSAVLSRLVAAVAPFVLAAWGLKYATGLTRAIGITGLLYGVGLLIVGHFDETRIFYEAYVLLVPAIVAGLLPLLREEPQVVAA